MSSALLALMILARGVAAGGAGTSFGEELRLQAAAPTAATGGIPLEEFTREELLLEGHQHRLPVGTRWAGVGAELSLWQGTRFGARGTGAFTEGVPATTERPDGSYGGEQGTVQATVWGGEAFAQHAFRLAGGGRMDVRLTVLGSREDLAGSRATGAAASGAGFWTLPLGEAASFLCWASAGPYGRGGGAAFASSAAAGLGLERLGGLGLAGGAEGFRFGAEGSRLGEGAFEGGAGGAYWFGARDAEGPGLRFILRAGIRGVEGGVAPVQPRFGFGVSLKTAGNFGVGADYAVVPFGDFGSLQFLSARLIFAGRLASPRAEAGHTLEGP